MGCQYIPLFLGQKDYPERMDGSFEKLLAVKGCVAPDGTETLFRVQYTNQAAFNVQVAFDEIGWIEHEIQIARKLMQSRLRLKLDRGAQELLEVAETALRPQETEVILDPLTGDRVFVYQFDNHSPLAIRMTPVDAYEVMMHLHQAVRRNRN